MTNDERSLEIVDELIDENEERGTLTIQQAAKKMNVTVAKFKALTKELATN